MLHVTKLYYIYIYIKKDQMHFLIFNPNHFCILAPWFSPSSRLQALSWHERWTDALCRALPSSARHVSRARVRVLDNDNFQQCDTKNKPRRRRIKRQKIGPGIQEVPEKKRWITINNCPTFWWNRSDSLMPIFFGCQDSTHDKGLIQEPVMLMDPDGKKKVPNLWQ